MRMDLDVPKLPVPTSYVLEQFVFKDPPGPDFDELVTKMELEDWMPVATRSAGEYIEALGLVLDSYYRTSEVTRRVWIETRIRI